MRTVTDRISNPFGMRPPCDRPCPGGAGAVFGYGDANADLHLIGDHPGRHGGGRTGIPFTDDEGSERLLGVLASVGLLEGGSTDDPAPRNLFMSYLHVCCHPDGDPPEASYRELERFFDAELRAISAHVLLPVGERAIRHVLETYTAKAPKFDGAIDAIHAREIGGSGFLVVPIADPSTWGDEEESTLHESLSELLASDYRQAADLTRFTGEDRQYLVR